MKKNIYYWIIAIIALGVIAGGVGYLMYNKPHPDYTQMQPEKVLSVEDLYSAFTSSVPKANALYTGKVIQVSGNVDHVETLDSTSIVVFVLGEGLFGDEGVRCTFQSDYANESDGLVSGSNISVKGYCTGYNETDVILEHCVLIDASDK